MTTTMPRPILICLLPLFLFACGTGKNDKSGRPAQIEPDFRNLFFNRLPTQYEQMLEFPAKQSFDGILSVKVGHRMTTEGDIASYAAVSQFFANGAKFASLYYERPKQLDVCIQFVDLGAYTKHVNTPSSASDFVADLDAKDLPKPMLIGDIVLTAGLPAPFSSSLPIIQQVNPANNAITLTNQTLNPKDQTGQIPIDIDVFPFGAAFNFATEATVGDNSAIASFSIKKLFTFPKTMRFSAPAAKEQIAGWVLDATDDFVLRWDQAEAEGDATADEDSSVDASDDPSILHPTDGSADTSNFVEIEFELAKVKNDKKTEEFHSYTKCSLVDDGVFVLPAKELKALRSKGQGIGAIYVTRAAYSSSPLPNKGTIHVQAVNVHTLAVLVQ